MEVTAPASNPATPALRPYGGRGEEAWIQLQHAAFPSENAESMQREGDGSCGRSVHLWWRGELHADALGGLRSGSGTGATQAPLLLASPNPGRDPEGSGGIPAEVTFRRRIATSVPRAQPCNGDGRPMVIPWRRVPRIP
jgi:hypothetical protein